MADSATPFRLPRLALLLLFLGSLGVFGLTAHGYVENTDAEITMHAARAWWLFGDPGLRGADRTPGPDGEAWTAEQVILDEMTKAENPRYGRLGVQGKGYVWFPIGHQALLVPAIALAQVLDRVYPEVEPRFVAAKQHPVYGRFFWDRFVTSFVSPLFAAGAITALIALLLAIGIGPRAATISVAIATFSTQFWPGTSETMSDMPGTFFLLATAALIALYGRGRDAGTLLWAGVLGGIGVLVRYPQALPLCGLGAWAAWLAFRRRQPLDLLWFVIGGLPPAALLVYANLWRFGDPLETGYSAAVGVGSYPIHWGLSMILVAFGKGILWFSVPLWFAFAQLGKRDVRRSAVVWFALATLVAPLPFFASLHYWAAGQCWGIRYLTGVIVLFVAVALALGKPWRSSPRTFWIVAMLGLLISVGGILTPYTGPRQFADPAAEVYWDRPGQAAALTDNINWDPHFSPLHTHWNYARLAASGDRLESGRSEDTTGPLFGVVVPDDKVPTPRREDTGFRHVWWRYVADYWPDFPALKVVGSIGALTLVLLALGLWRLGRWSDPGAAELSDAAPES